MKPTPQTSSNNIMHRRLPVTDHNYQSTLEATHAVVEHDSEVRESRGFWKLSAEVLAAKTTAEYVCEASVLGVIATLAAWPIVVALHSITRMVRGY